MYYSTPILANILQLLLLFNFFIITKAAGFNNDHGRRLPDTVSRVEKFNDICLTNKDTTQIIQPTTNNESNELYYGVMFAMLNPIVGESLSLTAYELKTVTNKNNDNNNEDTTLHAEVYWYDGGGSFFNGGNYIDVQAEPDKWKKVCDSTSKPIDNTLFIPFMDCEPIVIPATTTYSIYITLDTPNLQLSTTDINNNGNGAIQQFDTLSIRNGHGLPQYPFGYNSTNFGILEEAYFNGVLYTQITSYCSSSPVTAFFELPITMIITTYSNQIAGDNGNDDNNNNDKKNLSRTISNALLEVLSNNPEWRQYTRFHGLIVQGVSTKKQIISDDAAENINDNNATESDNSPFKELICTDQAVPEQYRNNTSKTKNYSCPSYVVSISVQHYKSISTSAVLLEILSSLQSRFLSLVQKEDSIVQDFVYTNFEQSVFIRPIKISLTGSFSETTVLNPIQRDHVELLTLNFLREYYSGGFELIKTVITDQMIVVMEQQQQEGEMSDGTRQLSSGYSSLRHRRRRSLQGSEHVLQVVIDVLTIGPKEATNSLTTDIQDIFDKYSNEYLFAITTKHLVPPYSNTIYDKSDTSGKDLGRIFAQITKAVLTIYTPPEEPTTLTNNGNKGAQGTDKNRLYILFCILAIVASTLWLFARCFYDCCYSEKFERHTVASIKKKDLEGSYHSRDRDLDGHYDDKYRSPVDATATSSSTSSDKRKDDDSKNYDNHRKSSDDLKDLPENRAGEKRGIGFSKSLPVSRYTSSGSESNKGEGLDRSISSSRSHSGHRRGIKSSKSFSRSSSHDDYDDDYDRSGRSAPRRSKSQDTALFKEILDKSSRSSRGRSRESLRGSSGHSRSRSRSRDGSYYRKASDDDGDDDRSYDGSRGRRSTPSRGLSSRSRSRSRDGSYFAKHASGSDDDRSYDGSRGRKSTPSRGLSSRSRSRSRDGSFFGKVAASAKDDNDATPSKGVPKRSKSNDGSFFGKFVTRGDKKDSTLKSMPKRSKSNDGSFLNKMAHSVAADDDDDLDSLFDKVSKNEEKSQKRSSRGTRTNMAGEILEDGIPTSSTSSSVNSKRKKKRLTPPPNMSDHSGQSGSNSTERRRSRSDSEDYSEKEKSSRKKSKSPSRPPLAPNKQRQKSPSSPKKNKAGSKGRTIKESKSAPIERGSQSSDKLSQSSNGSKKNKAGENGRKVRASKSTDSISRKSSSSSKNKAGGDGRGVRASKSMSSDGGKKSTKNKAGENGRGLRLSKSMSADHSAGPSSNSSTKNKAGENGRGLKASKSLSVDHSAVNESGTSKNKAGANGRGVKGSKSMDFR